MVAVLAEWLPQRKILVLGDSLYFPQTHPPAK
jgi:hypothetical protein